MRYVLCEEKGAKQPPFSNRAKEIFFRFPLFVSTMKSWLFSLLTEDPFQWTSLRVSLPPFFDTRNICPLLFNARTMSS